MKRKRARLAATTPALLWRLRRRLHWRREVRRACANTIPPVLVYQMAKVASSAVTSALRQFDQLSVFQVHAMHPDNLGRFARDGRYSTGRIDVDIVGSEVYRGLIRRRHPAKVITLVREPIGRNIAAYFEALDAFWGVDRAYAKVGVEQLIKGFFDRYHHEWTLDWFDVELKAVLGIDVYAHPFPRDSGYLRIDGRPYDLLVMRHDLDDASKARCVADFVPITGISIQPRNIAHEKPYASVYREFMSRIEIPNRYLDRMIDSKYARHFFGAEELARVRARWSRAVPTARL